MKKKNIIICVIVAIALLMVVGGFALLNTIFPKAPEIRVPDKEDILMISTGVNGDKEFQVEDIDVDKLLNLLGGVKPTREMSINDFPAIQGCYYRFEIKTSERMYLYYIYENNGEQVYVEVPYEGIYTAEHELLSFVLKYFEE